MKQQVRIYCPNCHEQLLPRGGDFIDGLDTITLYACGTCDYTRRYIKDDTSMNETVQAAVAAELAPVAPLKLDIGCGPNPKEGHEGVDMYQFNGKVRHVFDLRQKNWPFVADSVEAVHCAHFLEHLTNLDDRWERVNFFNELYRIMRKGSQLTLIFPHWCSNRYYGDPTHKEPFSEMGFYYLDRSWRMVNAPHSDISVNPNGYSCNWQFAVGYNMHPSLITRNAETQQFWMQWYKEACQDIIATLVPMKE